MKSFRSKRRPSDRAKVSLGGRRLFRDPHTWPRDGKVKRVMTPAGPGYPVYMRSRWEANYARLLDALAMGIVTDNTLPSRVVAWLYEPCRFEFPERKGARDYTPDFMLILANGEVVFDEVKGFMSSTDVTRFKRFRKHYPELPFRVIDERLYRSIEQKLAHVVPGWE